MKLTESQLHKFTNDAVLAHIRNLIEFKGSFTEDDIEPIIRERAIAYGNWQSSRVLCAFRLTR